ncbi:MAG TPA: Gfo/Idh/MocA family oxidoreductase [Chitinophagaceae bacterium]|nr:Gfo/Idh/MocA family oxidoreductase [Chitinophagaceae bacterium]
MVFNWGIIGPGQIAKIFADDLKFITGVQQNIGPVLQHSPSSGEEFSKKFNIGKLCNNMQQFVAEKMDAVYIATPHPFHHDEALACLKSRIPVLCEKPITINSIQLNELIKTSLEKNTFLMEGMWIRFLPSVKKLLELTEGNMIGKVLSIKAGISYRAPDDKDNRYFNPDLGGGSLLDLGIYPVFLATLLLGKPSAVKAVASISEQGIDKACSVLLDYEDDQYASLESSLITQSENQVAEITGEKGMIKILSPWFEKPAGIELEIYDETKEKFPCEWEGHGFQFEAAEVNHCLEKKRIESLLMPHALSLQVVEIMDEVRKQVNVKYEKFE